MKESKNWLVRIKEQFQATASTNSYQKYTDNPARILDDSLSALNSLKNSSGDKIKQFVEEFNKALPIVEAAGYELKTVEIRVGIPPKLIPHFNQVRILSEEEKREFLERHKDKRYTKLLLSTLFKSSEIQQSVSIGNLPQGVIQIELTTIPNIILVYGDY